MLTKKINEVYSLYESGKYKEAIDLNNEILKIDPNNIYAKRYASLLDSKKILNKDNSVPKVRGKQLKCPHCLSRISFSSLTEEQQIYLKSGSYNNLELKCPYCHIEFVLQKKRVNSIIGLKLGDKVTITGKKYRITGYVKYEGTWIEGRYSGRLSYIEWLLLGEDNSYKYFSEGYFEDDGEKTYEFEFSEKYIPKGKIDLNGYKEKNDLKVSSVYGENSKSYKIGEKVEILDFGDYVLEKEGSGRQREVGFYKGNKVSKSEALIVFNKKAKTKSKEVGPDSKVSFSKFFSIVFLLFIFFVFRFIIDDGKILNTAGFGLLLFFGISILLLFFGDNFSNKKRFIFTFFILGPIFAFLLAKPMFSLLDTKRLIDINKIDNGSKFEVIYNGSEEKVTKSIKYDYGGVRTYYESKSGIKFSVENSKDKEIIKNIINNGESKGGEIKNILNGKVYKIN